MSPLYQPNYANSWALVIGINEYEKCNHLSHARSDATGFADLIEKKLGFPAERITRLLDSDATKARILEAYLQFTSKFSAVQPDDRIVVFFAGHGHTESDRRGDVGFLVPVDGSPDNLETLIRWDELARYSDMIPAKHVMFVMDACFSGLMITRHISPGVNRFLKDMLQRYSRQVLTSGKANQTVADAGGPRAGHSIFTGHLLDALEGNAARKDDTLTANTVMAYVYDRVAKDHYSRQTPHYGFLDGDGDLIFQMPSNISTSDDRKEGSDILVDVPEYLADQPTTSAAADPLDLVKEYLSDTRYRIKLDDLVNAEIRRVLSRIGIDVLPTDTANSTPEYFSERLRQYETAVVQLRAFTTLIARWASADQQPLLGRIFARLAETNTRCSGLNIWLGLRLYPAMLLMYSGGIAALFSENYASLRSVLTSLVVADTHDCKEVPVIVPVVEGMLEVHRSEYFKTLPGHEKYYTPESEYIFKAVQPQLEDLLALGHNYERLFDMFEVLLALVYADIDDRSTGRIWGPIGRFGWKYRNRRLGGTGNPFLALKNNAEQQGANWPFIKAGLFRGSFERFKEISDCYEKDILQTLPWF